MFDPSTKSERFQQLFAQIMQDIAEMRETVQALTRRSQQPSAPMKVINLPRANYRRVN